MALSNNFIELLRPFISQVQLIENTLNDLKLFRSLNTATGAQLDSLGDILDVERNINEDDITYRLRLQLKVVENSSNGEPEVIINFVRNLTNSNDVEYRELFPAGVGLTIDGLDLTIPEEKLIFDNIFDLVQPLLGAGIQLKEVVLVDPNLNMFVLDEKGFFDVVPGDLVVGEGFLEKDFPEIANGYSAGALAEKA